ncbi:DinB family protein [Marininema halotolerans]|uniref:Uncharacterized damage-inducible protein DinB (Forms a four-helix bundle) n=1 Tax=Marininema halotolerans TaxID=1155944 RepID=A0A1I6UKB9_9BACL|nr:DinB family protein [Marininema halotolerans]SFT01861.1 Uncharacterized damage-inducible protein DinB (forms a four-helix bundle) [Marininema halotolerans]
MKEEMKVNEKNTSDMGLASMTKNFAAYNLWANTQLIAWLRSKPAEKMEREVPSSFPTIKLTLHHILQVETFWLSVLKQEPIQLTQEEYTGTMEALYTNLMQQSKELASYVDGLTESEIRRNCHVETPWFNETKPLCEFVLQIMNHGTYHRGQIVTMGRNVGLTDAPMTDFNYYIFYGKSKA